MYRRILAVLGIVFSGGAQADPLWRDASQPRSAHLYTGLTTPAGRQLIGGYYSGTYRRDTAASPWTFSETLNDTWSLARDAGGRTYAGGVAGMIAYSDNDGTSWQFNFLDCSPSCPVDLVWPTPSGAIIAAVSGGPTYRSTDRGLTWNPTTGGVPTMSVKPDIAARTDGTLVSVGSSYLTTSTDNGASWNSTFDMGEWLTVEPLPSNELLLGRSDGLYRRSAGGVVTQLAAAQITGRVSNLYRTSDGRWLVASEAGIWRGDANLATWTLVGPGIVGVMAFVPQAGVVLAIGVQGVMRSDAQFQNWQEDMNGMAHAAVAEIAAAGSRLFVATYGGEVFRSDDGAATWQRSHAGLPAVPIKLVRLDNGRLFALADRSSAATYSSVDNGTTWSLQTLSPAFKELLPVNATTAIAIERSAALWRSIDGGATWTRSPQAFDTQYPSNLVRGQDGVLWLRANTGTYRSVDLGATWQSASAGLPSPNSPNLWPVANGVLSFSNTQAYRYDTGSATWVAFGDAYTGTPAYAMMQNGKIVVDGYSGLLVGEVATGRWRRVAQGTSTNRVTALADGRIYGLSSYYVNSIRQLSDDRLFAGGFERP